MEVPTDDAVRCHTEMSSYKDMKPTRSYFSVLEGKSSESKLSPVAGMTRRFDVT